MKGRGIEIDKMLQHVFAVPMEALSTSAGDAFAQRLGCEWGYGPGMMGWGYDMGWFGTILMAAFWIAVIAGIVFLIRWLAIPMRPRSHGTTPGDSALEILEKTYARGEIDKQEFEAKKRDLA
jgi:putative membrane protein